MEVNGEELPVRFDPEDDWDLQDSGILDALDMEHAEFDHLEDTTICKHGVEIEMDGDY